MSSHETSPAKAAWVNRIRILVVGLPGLLGDIVREMIAPETDIEVVGRLSTTAELGAAVRRTRADLVVLACEDAEVTGVGKRLLEEHRDLRIVAIVRGGRRGVLISRQHARVLIDDISLQTLLAAIRGSLPGPAE